MDRPLPINFKSAHSNISQCCENECEGLLPDCRVGVKESESEDHSRWMHWQHAQEFTFWTMVATNLMTVWQCTVWMTVGQQDVRWLQVSAWHDHSYMAGIPLLLPAHGLTVKLSPCPCSYSSLAGRIAACLCGHSKCSLLLAQAHPRIQHLSSCYLMCINNCWMLPSNIIFEPE